MAWGLVRSLIFVLAVVIIGEVTARTVAKDKVYTPDEFDTLQTINPRSNNAVEHIERRVGAHEKDDSLNKEQYEIGSYRTAEPNLESRFLLDLPCRSEYVRIGNSCLRTVSIRGRK